LESFKENLKKLLEKSKKLTNKIVFIGLTPIDEQKVNPMPWAPGKSYMTDNLNKFDNALKILCQENRLCFIDINKKLTDLNYKELLEDGAHPNSEGHQKMFEIIKSSLLKNNIIAKT
jgi:lysophospholipase L1-like esterase